MFPRPDDSSAAATEHTTASYDVYEDNLRWEQQLFADYNLNNGYDGDSDDGPPPAKRPRPRLRSFQSGPGWTSRRKSMMGRFAFGKLPRELRDMVYAQYLPTRGDYRCALKWDTHDHRLKVDILRRPKPDCTTLLCVNKQINKEFSSHLHRSWLRAKFADVQKLLELKVSSALLGKIRLTHLKLGTTRILIKKQLEELKELEARTKEPEKSLELDLSGFHIAWNDSIVVRMYKREIDRCFELCQQALTVSLNGGIKVIIRSATRSLRDMKYRENPVDDESDSTGGSDGAEYAERDLDIARLGHNGASDGPNGTLYYRRGGRLKRPDECRT